MKHRLSEDWLTQGWVDYEYKKFLMLAYLQEIRKAFQKIELYPSMAELVTHYTNLKKIRESKDWLKESFPEQLMGIDRQKRQLQYKKIAEDDEMMRAIEEIIDFAYPKLREALQEGKEIYDFVEEHCDLSPVGVLPLYADEGYFMVMKDRQPEIMVHQYQITIVEHLHEKMRGIHSTLIERVQKGVGVTVESVKRNLISRRKILPNPATFLFHSKLNVPEENTLLPIAKRMVVQYVVTHT